MDHTEFKQYLSHLEELSPAQKGSCPMCNYSGL